MFSGSVIRRLTPSEQLFADNHMFFGGKAELRGEVDIDALSDAFDALCQTYPVFAARLEPDAEGNFYIVADDLLHPGMWLFGDDSGLEQTSSAGTRLDQSVSLMNLGLEVREGGAVLTLFVHHALADGTMLMGLVEELFTRYISVTATGDPGPIEPQPAPVPLEVMLEKRGIKKQARSGLEKLIPLAFAYDFPDTLAHGLRKSDLPQLIPSVHCRLTKEETAEVEEFSRANGLSFNAMVASAILLAEWQIRNTPHIPLPYLYPVNLRFYVNPPLTATEVTNPCGMATFLAEIGPTTDVYDLAERIVADLRNDLAEGIVQQSALHFASRVVGDPPAFIPRPVACTAVGALPDTGPVAGIEVVGFQGEVYCCSDWTVDYYSYGTVAGQLFIDHHSNIPGRERPIEAARELLCSVTSEYGMFME